MRLELNRLPQGARGKPTTFALIDAAILLDEGKEALLILSVLVSQHKSVSRGTIMMGEAAMGYLEDVLPELFACGRVVDDLVQPHELL